MKKILLSLAAVAMTVVANAAPTVVETNPSKANPLPANTVITDNEFITATTTMDATGGGTGSAYVFGDVDLTSTGWFELRSKAPDAANPFGAQDGARTSVKLEVKKPVTVYCYIRTGDNKSKAVKVFNSAFEAMPYANGEEGKDCGADGSNIMWEFSWTLNTGTYCLTETGGTGRMAGLGYEEATIDPEPAEGQEITFNLEDYTKWGKPEMNVSAKGTVIYNETDKTYTFPKFLGGNVDVTFAIEPVDGSENYKAVPTSGVKVSSIDYYGSTIDAYNFDGLENSNSIWFGLNGVNSVCLNNPMFYGYSASYASKEAEKLVENPTSPADYRYYYEVSFSVLSDYCNWDAATSAAGDLKTKGNFNLKFQLDIPAESESGIEDIVTDNVDENAPVEYYNLQGIRLSEPAAGQIVIRRQGSKVSKILVR